MDLVDLTRYLVESLLPNVDEIKINSIDKDSFNVIEVLVPNEYVHKIIGKDGRIANSIRTIVQADAYLNKLGKVRINIDSL